MKLPINTYRRLKKIKAISFSPINIFYEILAIIVNKTNIGRDYLLNSNFLLNNQLKKKNFQPVNLSKFTIDFSNIVEQETQISATLDKYGICILTNFIEHKTALNAFSEISEFLEQHQFIANDMTEESQVPSQTVKRPFGEINDYQWQFDYAKYSTYAYREIQSMDKPFINVRSRKENVEDSGKIDIFRFDDLAKKYGMDNIIKCHKALSHPEIEAFIEKFSGYPAVQSNLYFDGGVTTPRGPHIDNNLEQYKIFLYLSDVLDKTNGPYCFVPKSHKKRGWMSKERLINSVKKMMSTEVSSLEFDTYTKMCAPAGTAIISCQSGIHGAFPQSNRGRRALILGNYN